MSEYCEAPECRDRSLVVVNGAAFCRRHYYRLMSSLEQRGESLRTFDGNALAVLREASPDGTVELAR